MSDETKCCGNCRWFERSHQQSSCGRCRHPLPQGLYMHHYILRENHGLTCPCHALPVSQEVMEAVRRYRNDCEWVADPFTIADYFIQQNPQLKGNQ